MTDALKTALDRFDVPPLSAGLADRIAAAATAALVASSATGPVAAQRRDRRGGWRRGRQVLLGSLAAGLLSAGAVASGLLNRVGIEVPVLTAMLAPKSAPAAKPVRPKPKPAVARPAKAVPPSAISAPVVEPMIANPTLSPAERFALREERRVRRQAFAAAHPVAAAVIHERVRQELQRRAYARRQALLTPGIDPALPGNQSLDAADRLVLARAARRDRLAAERMIDRRIQAREARMAEHAGVEGAASPDPVAGAALVEQPAQYIAGDVRAARRAWLQQLTPEERALIRERMAQRRERRRAQQEQAEADGSAK